jgi:hypothetical protein
METARAVPAAEDLAASVAADPVLAGKAGGAARAAESMRTATVASVAAAVRRRIDENTRLIGRLPYCLVVDSPTEAAAAIDLLRQRGLKGVDVELRGPDVWAPAGFAGNPDPTGPTGPA